MDGRERQTFSRGERLKRRQDFRRCITRGRRSIGRYVVVYLAPNELGRTRLGAGSTARLGNAVQRNRQKRLVREAFRLVKHQLPHGVDLVVLPKVPWTEPTLDELEADVVDAARHAADTDGPV
ncbi:MAG: ribonuclease P protein component [Planctomycetota bacterium]